VDPIAGLDVSERVRKIFEQDAEILALKVVVCISTTAEHTDAESVTVQLSFIEKTGK
jgi:hypothetical protein